MKGRRRGAALRVRRPGTKHGERGLLPEVLYARMRHCHVMLPEMRCRASMLVIRLSSWCMIPIRCLRIEPGILRPLLHRNELSIGIFLCRRPHNLPIPLPADNKPKQVALFIIALSST
jgi:hypothetical protein